MTTKDTVQMKKLRRFWSFIFTAAPLKYVVMVQSWWWTCMFVLYTYMAHRPEPDLSERTANVLGTWMWALFWVIASVSITIANITQSKRYIRYSLVLTTFMWFASVVLLWQIRFLFGFGDGIVAGLVSLWAYIRAREFSHSEIAVMQDQLEPDISNILDTQH